MVLDRSVNKAMALERIIVVKILDRGLGVCLRTLHWLTVRHWMPESTDGYLRLTPVPL
jgi:hypothetical protein